MLAIRDLSVIAAIAASLIASCGQPGNPTPLARPSAPPTEAVIQAHQGASTPTGTIHRGGVTAGSAPTANRVTPSEPMAQSGWIRFGFDIERSGVNPNDTQLTTTNVQRLHQLWRTSLPGLGDSTPVMLPNLRFANGKSRDVLYLTTTDGQLVAVDATNGEILWTRATHGNSQLTKSSPVVDPSTQTVYSYGLDGYLHQYDAITGKEDRSNPWPVQITKMPATEKESSSLNLANGWIYVVTSGYLGDAPPYQGHVIAINEQTGASHVFNSLCSSKHFLLANGDCEQQRSGIWARAGVVVDPQTNAIYAVTGNGRFDANQGGDNYGDTILKLTPDATKLLDSYTPANYQELEAQDRDLSSTAPALLPRTKGSDTPLLMVQGGKDGKLRLVNRADLSGKGGSGHVGGEVQTLDSAGCDTFTQPAVWTDEKGKVWVFVAGTCGFVAYNIVTDQAGKSRLKLAWNTDDQTTSPVVAGGVIFAASSGRMMALDPQTGKRLWVAAIGDVHWESPIVVGDKVYVTDESGKLYAFGM